MEGKQGGSRASPGRRERYEKGFFSLRNSRDETVYWFIRYMGPDGKRHKERAGTHKSDARNLLEARRVEIRSGTWVDPRERKRAEAVAGLTFSDFADRFLIDYAARCRSDHYKGIVTLLKAHFGARLLKDISRADLDAFSAARLRGELGLLTTRKKARKVTDSTLRKNLVALGTMFKAAVRWGLIDRNPAQDIRKPSEPRHATRYLSPDEWTRVQQAAPPWLRPMLTMAIATGMRLKEVVGLRWEDIDRKAGLLHVSEDSKTGTRAIPMGRTVLAVLEGQVRHVRSPFVFVDEEGSPYTSKEARLRITRATIAVMEREKVQGATFHTLRHTAASIMVQSGIDLYEVQRILGHSTPVMTQRYAHLQPGHLRRGVLAIDAVLSEESGPTGPQPAHETPTAQPADHPAPANARPYSRIPSSRP
jgi:integrase